MSYDIKYIIEIDNLSWSFGEIKILDGVSLKLEKGKFYSIIGPNGSGKTTLLRNIVGALEAKEGTIFINGRDTAKIRGKELAKVMACVYQNTNIDFNLNVMDVVLMGRAPYIERFKSESGKDIKITEKAMEMTNTIKLCDKKVNEVSGGEKQRVMAARAIAQDTEIFLLDEPISNLDIYHQIELMDTIRELNINMGKTVISVLHDLNLAAQYSDYLILVKEGKIIAFDTPEKVITEENIRNVYNIGFRIIKNPVNGKPHIIPVTGYRTI